MQIKALRAQSFTLRVEHRGVTRKLLKLMFFKQDGSLAVEFPYFRKCSGILSYLSLPAGQQNIDELSYVDQGKVTSHMAKYVHHRSGEAHFSKGGRIRTVVKKSSVPLGLYSGHLFTAHAQGLDGFDIDDPSVLDDPWVDDSWHFSKNRVVTHRLTDDPVEAIKILGYCYTKKRLRDVAVGKVVGPKVAFPGGPSGGVLYSAPKGTPGASTYVVINIERCPRLNDDIEPQLDFIGGFDPPEIARDINKPTTCLVMVFPEREPEKMKALIGSVDLRDLRAGG